MKPRLHLFAEQLQSTDHALVRDERTAIELGEDTVQPQSLLQADQTLGDH